MPLRGRQPPQGAPSSSSSHATGDSSISFSDFNQFLPEAHQFISAAGVSSLVASVIFVVFLIVRFVRARMRITPWTAERYAEMTSTSPVTTGWSKLGHSVRRGAAREHKSPTPMMSPPQSARSSQARNLVFSTSEDTD